jgi:hypothetical protein
MPSTAMKWHRACNDRRMWSELAQLVARRSRSDSANSAEAQALLAVAGALAHCELAFEHVEHAVTAGGAPPEHADLDAALAMDAMLATLHNVQPVLELLQPEPARLLRSYLAGAPAANAVEDAKVRLRQAVQLLRHLLALEAAATPALMARDDFSHARRKLGALILERYPAGELWVA